MSAREEVNPTVEGIQTLQQQVRKLSGYIANLQGRLEIAKENTTRTNQVDGARRTLDVLRREREILQKRLEELTASFQEQYQEKLDVSE